jgi:hypothetical protein
LFAALAPFAGLVAMSEAAIDSRIKRHRDGFSGEVHGGVL